MNIQDIASRLLEAEKTRVPIEPITEIFPDISVEEAYYIQQQQIEEKVKNGAVIIGKKIGLTSKVMQEMFNVNEPDYGHLLDDMVYVDGDTVSLDDLIQPKLEFEIAFVLKKDLIGPGITPTDVINATEYIAPAFEVIDSRIQDWNIRFEDTVADNGSSSRVVIGGKPTHLEEVDLQHIGMVVYQNGKYLDSAAGAAVMGNPVRSVAWLVNALANYGISLKAGEIILSGALSKAVPIEDGDTFTAEFAHLGTVSASFQYKGRINREKK
ncbi:2-keto-4-pentenoate hydratase [Alkalihalobacterium elongatum]|uniref:2-keto-4-pentenoate hydratase n=1 Tax=Alkalihalobacterium elongatum TaxID=2675466 RepID=UPI001C1F2A4D|nr:2-keto-4-pentenoate hydratase [Alkalihalobacterium elongatum]